ncbi:hypothetical protein BDR05DRAFT_960287, partial [Suillus weaverae]
LISYPADSFVANVDLEIFSEEVGPAGNQQWDLDAGQHHRRWNVYLSIPNEWSELEVRKLLSALFTSDNSDATSSDELSEVVAPSLPAEEEIVPLPKRRPSLPTEECAPVKRRRAWQRVQTGKTRR